MQLNIIFWGLMAYFYRLFQLESNYIGVGHHNSLDYYNNPADVPSDRRKFRTG
jgi:hypothetical protein